MDTIIRGFVEDKMAEYDSQSNARLVIASIVIYMEEK